MKATEVQWIEFKSSFIWQDMKESIEEEIRLLHFDLEDPNCKLGMDELRFIQGKVHAMNHFLRLPDVALEQIQLDQEEQEWEENNRKKEE